MVLFPSLPHSPPPPPPPSPPLPSLPVQCFSPLCFLFKLIPLFSLSLQAVDSTKLWGVTWTRIDQFLPGFLKDLFPNVTPPPPPSPPSPPSSQSPPPVEQVDSSTSPDCPPTASSPLPVSQSPACEVTRPVPPGVPSQQ